jgi:hypothetical protein
MQQLSRNQSRSRGHNRLNPAGRPTEVALTRLDETFDSARWSAIRTTGRLRSSLSARSARLRDQVSDNASRPIVVVAVVALVCCALVAFMVGRSLPNNDSTAGSDASTQVSAGHLTLVGWPGWERGRVPSQVAGLVQRPRVVAPTATDVSVVVGDLPLDRVPRLFSVLGLKASSAETLKAGPASARSYTGVMPGPKAQSVMAVIVPTSAGASAAICVGAGGTTEAAGDCRTVLTTTITLRGATAGVAAPTAAAASALRSSVEDLDVQRRRDAAVLSGAATSGRQANAALLLSDDYKAIAGRVAAIDFTPLASASGRSLVRALNAGAAAYAQLARAADASSRPGYTAALGQALRADGQIARSLGELTALGYGREGQ